jgi:DNA-binding response OmpR family regulator
LPARIAVSGNVKMSAKVLIADDEPNIVLSLEFLLRHSGYLVHTAADGDEALLRIAEFQPDLILLDIMLPRKNGFEVCETIRKNPRWNDLKVVMLTAKGRESEVTKGYALRADAYITKPFDTRDLLANVQRLLMK